MAAGRWRAGLALLAVALGLGGPRAEQMEEHLKREHSLSKPYQGEGRGAGAEGSRRPGVGASRPGTDRRCGPDRSGFGQRGAVGAAGQRHSDGAVHPPHARRAEQVGSRVEPRGESRVWGFGRGGRGWGDGLGWGGLGSCVGIGMEKWIKRDLGGCGVEGGWRGCGVAAIGGEEEEEWVQKKRFWSGGGYGEGDGNSRMCACGGGGKGAGERGSGGEALGL